MNTTTTRPTSRTALITGAARGIGREYARALGREGYQLILVDLLADELSATARMLQEELGTSPQCLIADLSTSAGCEQVAARISELDTLDVLINNAGIRQRQPFPRDDLFLYRALAEINIVACVHLAWAALRKMQQQKRGYIANISSLNGCSPALTNYTMYSASKSFLIDFTRGIVADARNAGVQVQVVCPGFTLVEGTKDQSRRRFPRVMWMSVEKTVAAALRARNSRQTIVLPGTRNRWLLLAARLHLWRPLVLSLKLLERLRLLPRWEPKAAPTTASELVRT